MLGFQQYQAHFTAHIRNHADNKKPARVNDKRMAVYREIVFNNFYSSVSACFPVLLSILGKRRFKQLVKACFFQQNFTSPFFRELPKALVDFLQNLNLTQQNLPAFTAQLAHYEWAELFVSTLKTEDFSESIQIQFPHDVIENAIKLNPAHMLVNYDFPVHVLSKKHQPTAPTPTFLLLIRNADFELKFIHLNPLTFELLQIIEAKNCTGRQALLQIAATMQHPQPETIVEFGRQILEDLFAQGAIHTEFDLRKNTEK